MKRRPPEDIAALVHEFVSEIEELVDIEDRRFIAVLILARVIVATGWSPSEAAGKLTEGLDILRNGGTQ